MSLKDYFKRTKEAPTNPETMHLIEEKASSRLQEMQECTTCGFMWVGSAHVTCEDCGSPESQLVYVLKPKEVK